MLTSNASKVTGRTAERRRWGCQHGRTQRPAPSASRAEDGATGEARRFSGGSERLGPRRPPPRSSCDPSCRPPAGTSPRLPSSRRQGRTPRGPSAGLPFQGRPPSTSRKPRRQTRFWSTHQTCGYTQPVRTRLYVHNGPLLRQRSSRKGGFLSCWKESGFFLTSPR